MSSFSFLLDEHVNPRLQQGLRRHWPGITVWRIGEPGVPPLGTLDPAILEWCFANGVLFVTNDRASMPVHLKERLREGKQSNGIIVLNDDFSMGRTIDELATIWAATTLDEHINLIRYLPISNWE
ncbi:MAG: hypothetical protein GXP37_10895 [Chloroflexi bacterium]|nr:hypothetical protein [Chloroflexota bacterium]